MELMINSEATKDNLSIYHQNIQSLHNNEELSTMLLEKHLSPHFICLSEHHMKSYEIHNFLMPGYNVAANYCQSKYLKGGVCILARKDIKYQTIDIKQYYRDKIFEMCVVKLKLQSAKLILGCVYRAPFGNIHQFLDLLDDVLKCLHHS
jgi:hypothetical protein